MKKELRQLILLQREAMPREEVEEKSRRIADRLFSLPEISRGGTVMFFLSFRNEVHTLPMIERAWREGKRVVVPRTVPASRTLVPCLLEKGDRLRPGVWGILEPEVQKPVAPEAIEVVVMPGVAFDAEGNRLGYGGGYYDRFLRSIARRPRTVALAFELQVVERVPVGKNDVPVDVVVTEDRVIRRLRG